MRTAYHTVIRVRQINPGERHQSNTYQRHVSCVNNDPTLIGNYDDWSHGGQSYSLFMPSDKVYGIPTVQSDTAALSIGFDIYFLTCFYSAWAAEYM